MGRTTRRWGQRRHSSSSRRRDRLQRGGRRVSSVQARVLQRGGWLQIPRVAARAPGRLGAQLEGRQLWAPQGRAIRACSPHWYVTWAAVKPVRTLVMGQAKHSTVGSPKLFSLQPAGMSRALVEPARFVRSGRQSRRSAVACCSYAGSCGTERRCAWSRQPTTVRGGNGCCGSSGCSLVAGCASVCGGGVVRASTRRVVVAHTAGCWRQAMRSVGQQLYCRPVPSSNARVWQSALSKGAGCCRSACGAGAVLCSRPTWRQALTALDWRGVAVGGRCKRRVLLAASAARRAAAKLRVATVAKGAACGARRGCCQRAAAMQGGGGLGKPLAASRWLAIGRALSRRDTAPWPPCPALPCPARQAHTVSAPIRAHRSPRRPPIRPCC